jgi:S1-C subfamily serine protease
MPQMRQEMDYVCRWASAQWGQLDANMQTPSPPPASPRAEVARKATAKSSGSGFFVSPGLVVTNQHVAGECETLTIRQGDSASPAQLVASTERNDLALLRVEGRLGIPASLRSQAALGEDVTVAGHPLSGILSDDIVVTSGQVNSLAGLRNDPGMLQISAPVQPGNSGGPLIDRSGAVVGVVVAKLNVERLARVTGDMAQNVNFAIKPEVVRLFLDTNRVHYRTQALGPRLDGIALAEMSRRFTVQVLCEK